MWVQIRIHTHRQTPRTKMRSDVTGARHNNIMDDRLFYRREPAKTMSRNGGFRESTVATTPSPHVAHYNKTAFVGRTAPRRNSTVARTRVGQRMRARTRNGLLAPRRFSLAMRSATERGPRYDRAVVRWRWCGEVVAVQTNRSRRTVMLGAWRSGGRGTIGRSFVGRAAERCSRYDRAVVALRYAAEGCSRYDRAVVGLRYAAEG